MCVFAFVVGYVAYVICAYVSVLVVYIPIMFNYISVCMYVFMHLPLRILWRVTVVVCCKCLCTALALFMHRP